MRPPAVRAFWRPLRNALRLGSFVGFALLFAAIPLACTSLRPAASVQSAVSSAREPLIVPLEEALTASDVDRIEELHRNLPGKSARRVNFAWARAEIDGLEKREYYAHSGIQRLRQFSSELRKHIQDISVRPREPRFAVLCVNHNDEVDGPNCYPRFSDTELKILDELAGRLPDPSVAGHVLLYTDLYPCASCRNVMRQFLEAFPNVDLTVTYRFAPGDER
jgi:hypothetical protein